MQEFAEILDKSIAKIKKERLEEELRVWENKQFMNAMNDHWSDADFKYDRMCHEKIVAIRKELAEVSQGKL